ncbi:MAG: HNH endonuclease [Deltaproteobacteria bacterium]|nr:HNH endonuclease [Deltaproteobacteria bacterium]
MNVILLNLDYTYINSISVRRALKLLAKGEVTVEKYSERVIRTTTEEIAVPMILRLVYLVRQIYRKAVKWSKKNVMVRDEFKCVYCGTTENLNIDHVFLQSKGGKNTFENTATSCVNCNNRKGDRTLREAKMFFKNRNYTPYQPTVMEFIKKYLDSIGVYDLLVKAGIY